MNAYSLLYQSQAQSQSEVWRLRSCDFLFVVDIDRLEKLLHAAEPASGLRSWLGIRSKRQTEKLGTRTRQNLNPEAFLHWARPLQKTEAHSHSFRRTISKKKVYRSCERLQMLCVTSTWCPHIADIAQKAFGPIES